MSSRTCSRLSCRLRRSLLLGLAVCATWPTAAAKLFHNDGTVIEGKITAETPDDVRIETKFGVLTYQKTDLTRIERDVDPASRITPTPRPLDYTSLVTTGPIKPQDPPPVVPFAWMAEQGITAEMFRGGARPVPPKITTSAVGMTTAPAVAATPSVTPTVTPVPPPEPGPHHIGI
ncbi:MAG: hypothetical protein N2111_02965 [Candidatus Sumerlaeaceae bacterium]|nr:hypothetical protein [Candidatus Sumerlaeaceae bacterium]